MGANQRPGKYANAMTWPVDIVFCIDATESMWPFMDNLKSYAMKLYTRFLEMMKENEKKPGDVRIRIIAFRDYYYDGVDAMLATRFFNMPEETSEFQNVLNSIETMGGGDDPEDGLEALAFAMKSEWVHTQGKRRSVIIVLTDDETHDLGFGRAASNYPRNMPENFSQLTEWWNNPEIINQNAKRLLIFAPGKGSWNRVYESWNNVVHIETETAGGLESTELDQVLSILAQSC